jgi:hypothetical protein
MWVDSSLYSLDVPGEAEEQVQGDLEVQSDRVGERGRELLKELLALWQAEQNASSDLVQLKYVKGQHHRGVV